MPNPFQLAAVREDVYRFIESRQDRDGVYGAYRASPRGRTDLYSSCDMAWIRAILGEDLLALPPGQRQEWHAHINGFSNQHYGQPTDGSYFDRFGSSKLHANGMVIGALAVLGGRQKHPVKLYADFDSEEKVGVWLENIDWKMQWSGSHQFWGGMHCYSFSSRCTPAWRERVFQWLDQNVDEKTGWWRKGVPHFDRHQPLGGSVHIVPVYEHHARRFPYPERVVDSVLALQLPNGRWHDYPGSKHVMGYLELDALYALLVMQRWAPGYRKEDIRRGVEKYGGLVADYYATSQAELYQQHPHQVLAAVGAFGLLQQLAPERFVDSVRWTDIFTDARFYNTAAVEVF